MNMSNPFPPLLSPLKLGAHAAPNRMLRQDLEAGGRLEHSVADQPPRAAAGMKTPGVTVRPIRHIPGHEDFCEVFFENVRVPPSQCVGKLTKGGGSNEIQRNVLATKVSQPAA